MKSFHIILARKPFKGNFVSNVISELPSGINIGDIRIGTDKIMTHGYRNGNNGSWSKLGMFADDAKYTPTEHEGRFPTNIILSHTSDCELLGTKKIKSDGHWIAPTDKGLYDLGIKNDSRDEGNKLADKGKETVENWECINKCPISALSEASRFFKGIKK